MQDSRHDRPDPDSLLADIEEEEERARRGKLRIFFGASPGVGKTYAMLAAAHQAKEQGIDVLVGLIETHGRPETEQLLTGLELLPRRSVLRHQHEQTEFDLDAALSRKPELILVDELAHRNAPESRHARRWQDIEELLAAGIDVFTTVNVQHLDSVSDVVGEITGLRVFETVPDHVFDKADEIILVDLTPDELLQRLREGKVFLPHQAERARRNFFRKGNLLALRELALRRTAERVDEEVRDYRRRRSEQRVWPTGDSILVCIGADEAGDRLVRSAARMALALGAGWHAVHVETPTLLRLPSEQRQRILSVLAHAESLGAQVAVLSGEDAARIVADFARSENISRIFVGRESQSRWRAGFVERLARAAPEVDLIRLASDDSRPLARERRHHEEIRRAALSSAIVLALTTLLWPLRQWLGPAAVALLLLLAASLHRQILLARDRENRLRALYEMAKELSATLDSEQIAQIARRHMQRAIDGEATLLLPDASGRLHVSPAEAAQGLDEAVAQWALDHGEEAGRGSATLPASPAFYLPLCAPVRVRGIIAVSPKDDRWSPSPELRQLLTTSATLIATALERVHYLGAAQHTLVHMESERLRNSLLAALSHDLRKPLNELTMLADTLAQSAPQTAAERDTLARKLRDQALRSAAQLSSLLDMAKLQAGVRPRREWMPLSRAILPALDAGAGMLAAHQVKVEIPSDLPLVEIDAELMERAFAKLFENAAQYTPTGSLVEVRARRCEDVELGAVVEISVTDNGPGFPEGREAWLFEKFTRVDQDSANSGIGLGLAIVRAIVDAHGGRVSAENRPQGGARFVIRLPAGHPPLVGPGAQR